MTVATARLGPRPISLQGPAYWTLLVLLPVGAVLLGQVWLAPVLLLLGLGFLARPFDLHTSLLALACAATFVNYEGGELTRDLSIVSLLWFYALACWALAWLSGSWGLPRSSLTTALLVLGASTLLALMRGLAAGQGGRFLGLDLIPMLAMSSALLWGGVRISQPERRLMLGVLILLGLAHVALGLYSYVVIGSRTGGLYFTAIPAVVALLLFNRALREPAAVVRLGWLSLTAILLLHQFLSFARGYWLGLLVSLPFSCWLYGRSGEGAGRRWRQVAASTGLLMGLFLLGILAAGMIYGWSGILGLAGSRLASSFETKLSTESASNVARLIEYATVLKHIQASPWLGQGLGFGFTVKQVLLGETYHQWFSHQVYLWIWLKQGLLGLGALLAAIGLGSWAAGRGSMSLSRDAAAWCAGAAAGVIHLGVVAMTELGLSQVNSAFLIALLWGMTLSLTSKGRVFFVWRRRAAATEPPLHP